MVLNESHPQNQAATIYRRKNFVLRKYMLNLLLTFAVVLCRSCVVKREKWMEMETKSEMRGQ